MKRIPSLDGLRAISILAVLLGHLAGTGRLPRFLSIYASSGVRMFFVISGFLITTLLLREHAGTLTINLRKFYVRRAYRILPAASVFMLFAIVVYWRELRGIDIAAMVFYFLNFDLTRPWMIGHLWSLSVEEQFYLLWPGVLKLFFRQKVAVLWTSVFIAPVFCLLCFHFNVPGGGYGMFPSVAGNLAIGCLAAIYGDAIPKMNLGWILLMLLAVIFIPYFPANTPMKTVFEQFILWPIMNCSMAGILIHVVRNPYRFLNIAPVMWLGRISYSLYLWQQPFFFAQDQPSYKLLFGIILACLSYYLVEKPMLALREKGRNKVQILQRAGGTL